MWNFKAEQKKFEVGGVKVGGVPGERPVVLIGSIFYRGHEVVKDEEKLVIDREKAEGLIKRQEELSDRTGNPCMVDVVASSPEAAVRFLGFVSEVTDSPMLLDGADPSTRIAALSYASEVGLLSRLVYNSLSPDYSPDEIEKIKSVKLSTALLLCLNKKDFGTRGRVAAAKSLIPIVHEAGITRLIVDTVVLDIPTLGMACMAIHQIKDELGYPVGCGAHNAVAMWKGLETKMGLQAEKPSNAVACAMSVAAGADFVLYGPIENADYVFPTVSMMDASYAQLAMEQGKRPDKSHPRFRIG